MAKRTPKTQTEVEVGQGMDQTKIVQPESNMKEIEQVKETQEPKTVQASHLQLVHSMDKLGASSTISVGRNCSKIVRFQNGWLVTGLKSKQIIFVSDANLRGATII